MSIELIRENFSIELRNNIFVEVWYWKYRPERKILVISIQSMTDVEYTPQDALKNAIEGTVYREVIELILNHSYLSSIFAQVEDIMFRME